MEEQRDNRLFNRVFILGSPASHIYLLLCPNSISTEPLLILNEFSAKNSYLVLRCQSEIVAIEAIMICYPKCTDEFVALSSNPTKFWRLALKLLYFR